MFYISRLRAYHKYAVSSTEESDHPFEGALKDSGGRELGSHVDPGDSHARTKDL